MNGWMVLAIWTGMFMGMVIGLLVSALMGANEEHH